MLCKVFGWTPAELDAQDEDRVLLYLAFYNAERRASAERERANAAEMDAKAQRRKGYS